MKVTAIAILVAGQLTLLPVVAAFMHIGSVGTVASVGESVQAWNVRVIHKRTGYEIISNKLTTDPWPNSAEFKGAPVLTCSRLPI